MAKIREEAADAPPTSSRLGKAFDPAASTSVLGTVRSTVLITLGLAGAALGGAALVKYGFPVIGRVASKDAHYLLTPEVIALPAAFVASSLQYAYMRDLSYDSRNSYYDRYGEYGKLKDEDGGKFRSLLKRVRARSISLGVAAAAAGIGVSELGPSVMGKPAASVTGLALGTAASVAAGIFVASVRKGRRFNAVPADKTVN